MSEFLAEARRLADYHKDVKELDLNAFAKEHGEAFLLFHGALGKMKILEGKVTTVASEGKDTRPDTPFNPQSDFAVFPVRRLTPVQPDDDYIWLGRSEENDVVIPDVSISAVHAFVRLNENGRYIIQDMNSMNGSFVNDEQVPAQGMGPAAQLETGTRVRLGSIVLTFVEANEFRELVARLLD